MGSADTFPFRTLPAPVRFAMAFLTVGSVFLLERSFDALIDSASLYLLLGMAVMLTAWLAGTGPGLSATILGGVLGSAFDGDGAGAAAAAHGHLALFVVHGLLVTFVVRELRHARRMAEQRAVDAQMARRQGEAASRAKDEFLATISHELRTPLNAVLGWVHLLRTGRLDPPTTSKGLESIDRNIRLQAQLTADLLDLSKALNGSLALDVRPLPFGDIVRQAVAVATPAAHAKRVRLTLATEDARTVVLGDSARMRQVAWQLLSNAIKFTPTRGEVSVVVRRNGETAWLIVEDSGPGISPEFLPRIFDRFTQQDPSPTRATGGLGVGLALARELVELQGGRIEAENRSERTGARFTVSFPLQSVEAQPEPEVFPAGSTAAPLDGVRVLVLDQDVEGRELVRTVLVQHGAVVRTVGSVAEALEALESWSPDVLVSDTGSPDHDRYALVGKVRTLESDRGGRIPAVALTTRARTDERVREILCGVLRDIPKPVEPDTLMAEVARLSGRERRQVQR